MDLAASVKTNGTDITILHNSFWSLFSTNIPYAGDMLMIDIGKRKDFFNMSQRSELIVNVFAASAACVTPQEERVMGFAKALAFMRNAYVPGFPFPIEFLDQNAYDAMIQKLIENGAQKTTGPIVFSGFFEKNPKLIRPHYHDPEEVWIPYERVDSLHSELGYASRKIFVNFESAAIGTRKLPQEERDRICAEIISMQILTSEEERSIKTAFSADP